MIGANSALMRKELLFNDFLNNCIQGLLTKFKSDEVNSSYHSKQISRLFLRQFIDEPDSLRHRISAPKYIFNLFLIRKAFLLRELRNCFQKNRVKARRSICQVIIDQQLSFQLCWRQKALLQLRKSEPSRTDAQRDSRTCQSRKTLKRGNNCDHSVREQVHE